MVSVGVPLLESNPIGRLVPDLRALLFYADVMRVSSLGLSPTMLDAACGSGRQVVQASQSGWDVVALEASVDLLAYTEQRARRQGLACLSELGTIHTYAGPSAAFDLVVLAGAAVEELDSVFELTVTIEQAASFVCPGGLLLQGIALDDPTLTGAATSAIEASGLEVVTAPDARDRRPGMVGYALGRRPETPSV